MEKTTMFILYVSDQQVSRDFYAAVLGQEPILDVPGMTEFNLPDGSTLGLMPEAGIQKPKGMCLGLRLPSKMVVDRAFH